METRTVEQVESWQTRPFADGFAGLRELSDGEFSGAVRAGGAWLFMLNGRIIGVYEGGLDDFEDADGTAYAAPHPSLPLLFSMQEQGGQTQAKYYTNDTPLSEVDSTLSQGSFTGYVELSENVLSGDYYVAYYGGRSMSVAFVGASEQVLTGDEAFERADDEVGIYEVRDVDVEVVDVPEPDDPEDSAATAGGQTASSEPSARSGEDDAGGSSAGATPRDGATSDTDPSASGPPSDDRTPSGAATDGQSAPGRSDAGRSAEGQPATDRSPAGRSASDAAARSASDAGTSERPRVAETETEPSADPERDRSPPQESERSTAPEPDGRTSDAGTAGPTAEADATAEGSSPVGSTAGPQSASSADAARTDAPSGTDAPSDGRSDAAGEEAATEDVFEEEDEWRETTTIPSLDPDRSESPGEAADDESAAGGAADDRPGASSAGRSRSGARAGGKASGSTGSTGGANASASRTASGASGGATASGTSSSSESAGSGTSSGGAGTPGETGEKAQGRVRELRTRLEQREEQVERLKERLSTLESERNEYKRERDALRQEVERLEAKLGSGGSTGSAGGRRLGRSQAFDGTNLFVRYRSKGQSTLAEAAAGEADPEDVNANLRLEHHTQFEADDVTVAGDSFEEFLTDSFEYRFVSWVVEHLLYEIRDTGHRDRLGDLYEAIPRIDRVDLHGSVDAGSDDDTRQESFDVVMRDKMGNPLVVADLNKSRDPTTGEMMGSLVDASTGVAETHDELAGAFQVTESFFEPAALETAESATSGGFLSREKRESFVKLSRKQGYHLCLVESRSGGFHLNVPEL